MRHVTEYLRDIYLTPLQEERELYIGVELEFPIVAIDGQATNLEVSQSLMVHLVECLGAVVEKCDSDSNPVELRLPETGDTILFEVSYTILEIAFAKSKTIGDIAKRFETYLNLIQGFLRQHGHELQGKGIHPAWQQNDNKPVALPRYQMLMAYLRLSEQVPKGSCHAFPDYGAFICGNQVQLDVTKHNYRRVLNAFNKIEAAKAYLFANSSFSGADWKTRIARDIFWEESMHGLLKPNVGVYPEDFQDDQAYLIYQSQTAMFTVVRRDKTYYFPPLSVVNFLSQETIDALDLAAKSYQIRPCLEDLAHHRSYHYQALTRRGTVEFRSVCTQPLELTFAPTAFHLGLMENLAELEAYLAEAPFFTQYGRDYPSLRRKFASPFLSEIEKNHVREFSEKLLDLAIEGLEKRGFSEEKHLLKLKTSKE